MRRKLGRYCHHILETTTVVEREHSRLFGYLWELLLHMLSQAALVNDPSWRSNEFSVFRNKDASATSHLPQSEEHTGSIARWGKTYWHDHAQLGFVTLANRCLEA